MNQPQTPWQLNGYHIAIPIAMAIITFIFLYIALYTIPVYLAIIAVMHLPKLARWLRFLLLGLALPLYAYAYIIFADSNPKDPNGFSGDLLALIILLPILNYILFIWAGYPSFAKLKPKIKFWLVLLTAVSPWGVGFLFNLIHSYILKIF